MSPNSPWLRALAVPVAIVLAIRLMWELIRPVLPALAVVLLIVTVIRIAYWYRNRW